jgi:hypothetical protein
VGSQAQLHLANATGDRKVQRDHDRLSIRRSTVAVTKILRQRACTHSRSLNDFSLEHVDENRSARRVPETTGSRLLPPANPAGSSMARLARFDNDAGRALGRLRNWHRYQFVALYLETSEAAVVKTKECNGGGKLDDCQGTNSEPVMRQSLWGMIRS